MPESAKQSDGVEKKAEALLHLNPAHGAAKQNKT